jgi:hypothetical protein
MKGDLSGVATPGEPSEKLLARTAAIGQEWTPAASVTEYFALGGVGKGVPVRATVSGFGPLLLSKVLGLNETQESSLGLVFHYADANGLALVDLSDLRAVLTWLTSDDGKDELKALGGLSSATAGVILRKLITFADDGADVFFGEPEFDVRDFLRTAADGRGVISLLEVPGVADKPALFSTFLMYLLAELFEILPKWATSTSRSSCSSSTRPTSCSAMRPRRSWPRSRRPSASSGPRASASSSSRRRRRTFPPTCSASSVHACSMPSVPSPPTMPRRCERPSARIRRAATTSNGCCRSSAPERRSSPS